MKKLRDRFTLQTFLPGIGNEFREATKEYSEIISPYAKDSESKKQALRDDYLAKTREIDEKFKDATSSHLKRYMGRTEGLIDKVTIGHLTLGSLQFYVRKAIKEGNFYKYCSKLTKAFGVANILTDLGALLLYTNKIEIPAYACGLVAVGSGFGALVSWCLSREPKKEFERITGGKFSDENFYFFKQLEIQLSSLPHEMLEMEQKILESKKKPKPTP